MTHVVIRCDASAGGGIGHLVRAISVAGAARAAGWSVTIAGAVTSALGRDLIEEAQLPIVAAKTDLGVLAAEQGATVVHVDDYLVGIDARAQVHAADALLSSMEDGTFGRRPADIAVDSTVAAEVVGRPDDGSGATLLGIAYAPMRAEVRAARELRAGQASAPAGAVDVLIVMGGTDATGSAATMAGICRDAAGVGHLTVIAPPEAWPQLYAEAGDDVELIAPAADFLERAARTDLVVSAAGTTSWELACIGVPSLLVAVVENQRAGLEAAVTAGVARGLGTLEAVRADRTTAVATVEEAVHALLDGRSWAQAGLEMVDGRGADRIVAAWSDALAARTSARTADVVARRATIDDSLRLLRWRNDPTTRAVSRSTAAITWDDHAGWFERLLEDSARELYVVERAGTPVGAVRFDEQRADEWEVSITLAPEARGLGLARSVLATGEAAFLARHDGVSLVAAVLPNNAPSQRLFRGAGYAPAPQRTSGGFDLLVRTG